MIYRIYHYGRVLKTTVGFNDLLGLTEFRKGVILMAMAYYSERILI